MLPRVVELNDDALPGGPLPNPTRSLLLGDPAGGALVYGCVIDLDDGEIAGGIRAGPAAVLAARASIAARDRARSGITA